MVFFTIGIKPWTLWIHNFEYVMLVGNVDGSYRNGCVSCWDSSLDFRGRGPKGQTLAQGRMRVERGWRPRLWGSAGDSESCTHWLRHHNLPTLPFVDSPVLLYTPVTQQCCYERNDKLTYPVWIVFYFKSKQRVRYDWI